jgi:hypothetical protein
MNISTAVQGTITLLQVGQEIYQSIVNAMDSAEVSADTGINKKRWVLAYAKSLILEAGKNWDKWAKYISDFIDATKAIYNSVKGIL